MASDIERIRKHLLLGVQESLRPTLEIIRQSEVWRREIAASQEAARMTARLVGQRMADFAALETARGIRRSLNDLEAALSIGRARVDLAALQESLRPWFASAARIAATDWTATFRRWNDEQRELDERLRRYGWWLVGSWTPSMTDQVLDLARSEGKRAVDAALCEHYRESRQRRLRRLVDGWMGDDAYHLRGAIIRDALVDHSRGRYRVSVPTLLPVVEGIVVDVFQPKTKSVKVAKILATSAAGQDYLGRVLTDSLLALVTSLWSNTDFSATSPLSRALNRHLILHGRTVRYGTETNSLKVFLALEQLASEVRRKRADERTASVAP